MRLDGTKGTLIGELSGTNSQLIVSDHLSGNEESIDLETKYDEGQHGGGDSEMLFDIVNNFKVDQSIVHSEEDALEKILDGTVIKGDVIVIRYEGPKGGPGMREMLSPTSAIMGRGLGIDVALITDGRFSGGSHGFVIGHITPEAQEGGLIAIVEKGDKIVIDISKCRIDLELSEIEIKKRKTNLVLPNVRYNRGVLAKYSKTVSSASLGAVTDLDI